MYKIDENIHPEKYTLLLPETLDAHFPLLKYMFWSKKYHVVLLDNEDGLTDTGLRYSNNEMCYPFIAISGQVINALESCKFDISRCRVLIPTAGDSCRGANYIGLLKKALTKSGLDDCKVLTMNVRHIEDDINLEMGPTMAIRGLFGVFYGDILLLLSNQVRPYEKEKGATMRLFDEWVEILADDIRRGKNLTLSKMKKNFDRICESFASIKQEEKKKQRIGLVGEFYAKYCHLGNFDSVKFIEENDCEVHINGFSWYILYYIDTHMPENRGIEYAAFRFVRGLFKKCQDNLLESIAAHGFYALPGIDKLKSDAFEYVSQNLLVGDGWLMGAETVGYAKNGIGKILCIAPFGCMPNVCAGRGLYPYLQRKFPNVNITSVEVDASGAKGNCYNRIEMLIDAKHHLS